MDADFLPDGGIAFAEQRLYLPPTIIMTQACIVDQPLQETAPGKTMICTELFGHLFSFLISMKPEALLEHFDDHVLLVLTGFTAGPLAQSALGEDFRDVLCEVKT